MKRSLHYALVIFAVLACQATHAQAQTYYVAPNGNDLHDGSSTAPWATVGRCLQQVRKLKAQSSNHELQAPVTFQLAPGTYYQTSTINITELDSGNAKGLVSFVGKNVVLSGGKPLGGWIYTGNGMWQVHLSSSDFVDQFWIGGMRRNLSSCGVMHYDKFENVTADSAYSFLSSDALPTVTDANGVRLVVYQYWTASIHQVAKIDTASKVVTVKNPMYAKYDGEASGHRFYLQNVKSCLEPGTFHFDTSTKTITYNALKGEDLSKETVVLPQLYEVLIAEPSPGQYVDYFSFQNIAFMHTKADMSACFQSRCNPQSASSQTRATVRLVSTRNWDLTNVTIAHTGGYALWFGSGSRDCSLSKSHLHDLGAGGVRIGKPIHGEETTQTSLAMGIDVSDNIIEDGGHVYQSGTGVLLQSAAKCTVQHNAIRYLSYTGISAGWTWGYAATSNFGNIISYNLIHHIGLGKLSDMGCIYTLGRSPGTVLDHNVCHDVDSFGYGGWGYYTDEGSSNITITNNIVYDTKCAGLHQHYGTDNLVENNIFALPGKWPCPNPAAGCDNAAVRSSPSSSGYESKTSLSFQRNIVYIGNGSLFYSTTDRSFSNFTFDYNTYWSSVKKQSVDFPTKPPTFTQWQTEGQDKHSFVADPEFVDVAKRDFEHLQQSSPALKNGFKPIDTSQVGPRVS